MNLIYIINTRIPTEKAYGFQVSKTCEKFSENGVNTELWFPKRKNPVEQNIFDYYGVKENFIVKEIPSLDLMFLNNYFGGLFFSLQSLFFAIKILFKTFPKDTVVYSRDFLIVTLLKLKGLDVVYNVHNWSKKRGLFLKLFLIKDTKIVCNSSGTKEEFSKRGFKNLISVPNGVDIEKFDVIREDKKQLRKKLGLENDKKIVLYLGHLYTWKGFDLVFNSAKKEKDERIVFVVVGGTKTDLEKYKNKKKQERVGNIIFTGHKQQKDTPFYLKSADVLLLPNVAISEESVKYTSPIKMFEYMASGVPIVASDLPSIREVLNEENSLLVEQGSEEALLSGVNKILGDKEFAESVSSTARKDVDEYTWINLNKLIIDFIKQ
ncbi:glycosyltransferase [Patescibacteria group bacterium]